MTDCKNCAGLLTAYADNELDAAAAARVRDHLGACENCRTLYRQERAVKDAVRLRAPYHEAPAGLSARVKKATGAKPPSLWMRPLVPAASLAALACALLLYFAVPAATGQTDEIVAEHVRSLMEHHLTDVTSTDRHTVKPWFAGRIDFSPPVSDFAAQGFPLLGGRLDYLQRRDVAALVYRRDKHLINVFIAPEAGGDTAFKTEPSRGFNMVRWRKGGLAFTAISDLNAGELQKLAALIAGK
jgi:anti-sigma factor (TIGR02949 family)